MKEDILEQITADYLNLKGYFVLTNTKYKPSASDPEWNSKQDGVHSDIAVIGFHPCKSPPYKVIAVNCKSWQDGFRAAYELKAIGTGKVVSGGERWKAFRELASPKWGRAFKNKIYELTQQTEFEHWIVYTKFVDPCKGNDWTSNPSFHKNLTPHLRIPSLKEIFTETMNSMTTTPANSELGRLIQLLKSAIPDFSHSLKR
ncbi:MAG: hypothetical protein QF594_01855 [Dehalococcoidales bacterium]|jgi:hypothetical protein|nr:hypothetical protein [Dehalococcoidales bacterium]|tara:strand:- start:3131 stop:3733 length:603 start_codon:yes stop_codon:yes gene_type:complete